MQYTVRSAARVAAVGLALVTPALAQPAGGDAASGVALTMVGGREMLLRDMTTPYAALHFGAVDAAALAREASTMPGLMHLAVSGDGASGGEGGPMLALVRDEGGVLASRYGARAAEPVVVIVDRAGAEVARVEGDTAPSAVRARYAEATRAMAAEYNVGENRLAIEGYDPVAYFEPGKPAKGSERITAEFRGAVYRFASEESRARFAQDPERYAPTYGGWCASAMAYKGEKVGVDPKNFKIKDGRLHLFYKSLLGDALKDWNKNEKTWEPLADSNWTKLSGETPRVRAR